MTLLLIDAGNTRIKWARCTDGRLERSHAAAHGRWTGRDFARRLLGARPPERVLVASVAGVRVRAALTQAARRAGVPVEFLRVPRRGGGVTVGYAEPWRLGVDRFAGLVGAHALFGGVPLLVTGVGTALTLDLVGGGGRHFGGAIIPSPALMVATLLERTQGIRRRARGGARRALGLFGRSTRAAITRRGALRRRSGHRSRGRGGRGVRGPAAARGPHRRRRGGRAPAPGERLRHGAGPGALRPCRARHPALDAALN